MKYKRIKVLRTGNNQVIFMRQYRAKPGRKRLVGCNDYQIQAKSLRRYAYELGTPAVRFCGGSAGHRN